MYSFQDVPAFSEYVVPSSLKDAYYGWEKRFLLSGLRDFLDLRDSGEDIHDIAHRLVSQYFACDSHEYFMALALVLAHYNIKGASPNPCVGCVYVKDSKILAMGYTQNHPGVHGERHAYQNLQVPAQHLKGARAYISLEPCCEPYADVSSANASNMQEPCVALLVKLGVSEVFIPMLDPDIQVSGAGVKYLLDHGIAVQLGLFAGCAGRLLSRYELHRKRAKSSALHKQVICVGSTWAQSLDGKLATEDGKSQWISSPESLVYSQWLRYVYDAVMVGANTFINDRPALSLRHPFAISSSERVVQSPIKVIFDPHLRTLNFAGFAEHYRHIKKGDAKLVWLASKAMYTRRKACAGWKILSEEDRKRVMCIMECDEDIKASHSTWLKAFHSTWLKALFSSSALRDVLDGALSLLVEGGPRLHGLLMGAGVVDFVHMVTAPKWLGGGYSIDPVGSELPHDLNAKPLYTLVNHQSFGEDMLTEYMHVSCDLG